MVFPPNLLIVLKSFCPRNINHMPPVKIIITPWAMGDISHFSRCPKG